MRGFVGACRCLPPTTVLRHVVLLRPSPLPHFFKKCGGKTSSGGQEHYILNYFIYLRLIYLFCYLLYLFYYLLLFVFYYFILFTLNRLWLYFNKIGIKISHLTCLLHNNAWIRVGELKWGFQDVAYLTSRASYTTIFN